MEPSRNPRFKGQRFASSSSPHRKDLTQLLNITAKFAGSGGSKKKKFLKKKTFFLFSIDYNRCLFFGAKKTYGLTKNQEDRNIWRKFVICILFINTTKKDSMKETTIFKKYYDRGDLPIAVRFHGAIRKVFPYNFFYFNFIKVTWKIENFDNIDYHLHLPIFFEG